MSNPPTYAQSTSQSMCKLDELVFVADPELLRGVWLISGGSKGARGTRDPLGPKFLYYRAVFGKNWPNNRLASPLWG